MSKKERRKKKVRALASEKKLSYQQASQQLEAEKTLGLAPAPTHWAGEVGLKLKSLSVARNVLWEENGWGYSPVFYDKEPEVTSITIQGEGLAVVKKVRRVALAITRVNTPTVSDPCQFAEGLAAGENRRLAQLLNQVRESSKVTCMGSYTRNAQGWAIPAPGGHERFNRYLLEAEDRRPRAARIVASTEILDFWKQHWGEHFQTQPKNTQIGTLSANGLVLEVHALDALNGEDLFVLPARRKVGIVGDTRLTRIVREPSDPEPFPPFEGFYMGLMYADYVFYIRTTGQCYLPRAWTLTEED